MSSSSYRFPLAGIILIVVLRMSIGWQFVYEGFWKIHSKSTAKPWTAEGYLKNAAGPFRDYFRNMPGDPDDLDWLDADKVSARWDSWRDKFTSHYALDEKQSARLNELVDGPKSFAVALDSLPKGVAFEKGSLAKVVSFDAKAKRLICPGSMRMIPAEREALLKLAPGDDKESVAYRKAVTDLFKRATAKLSYKEQARASLVGDPDRAGVTNEKEKGTIDYHRMGEIELYKNQVERYNQNLKAAKQDFNHVHLARQFSELQELKAKVVGPIKAMDASLKEDARKLLTGSQLEHGPVSMGDKIESINSQTIMGLTVLGICLLFGFLTRPAAVGGAVMLMMFYLVMPPWPGVPEAPGPEHSFIVNKNLIEVFALLVIAALPTGQWFGVDSLLFRFCCRKKGCCGGSCHAPAPAASTTTGTTPTADAPAANPAKG